MMSDLYTHKKANIFIVCVVHIPMFCCGGYQNKSIREALSYIDFLEAKYVAYYSKHEANRQHCKRFRIVTPEVKPIQLTDCRTNTSKTVLQTYVSVLERSINILLERTYDLRLIFILVYYGQHNTLKAIPRDIVHDIRYKYPTLYSSFKVNTQYVNEPVNTKEKILSSKKVRFLIK